MQNEPEITFTQGFRLVMTPFYARSSILTLSSFHYDDIRKVIIIFKVMNQ